MWGCWQCLLAWNQALSPSPQPSPVKGEGVTSRPFGAGMWVGRELMYTT